MSLETWKRRARQLSAQTYALYLPQLHAQKEKLEADLQELKHLALWGWGYADFHAGVNFAITEFSEVRSPWGCAAHTAPYLVITRKDSTSNFAFRRFSEVGGGLGSEFQ